MAFFRGARPLHVFDRLEPDPPHPPHHLPPALPPHPLPALPFHLLPALPLLLALCALLTLAPQGLPLLLLRGSSPAPPSPAASPSPSPLFPRVAVCVTGSTRTFTLPPVYSSINRTLIAPVQRLGGAVDVYIYLTSHHRNKHQDSVLDSECGHDPLPTALGLLRPVHVELWPNASSCASGVRFFNETCCGREPGGLREITYLQSGWVAKCFARAEAHALEGGFAYTHFVRTRSDLWLGAEPPAWV